MQDNCASNEPCVSPVSTKDIGEKVILYLSAVRTKERRSAVVYEWQHKKSSDGRWRTHSALPRKDRTR